MLRSRQRYENAICCKIKNIYCFLPHSQNESWQEYLNSRRAKLLQLTFFKLQYSIIKKAWYRATIRYKNVCAFRLHSKQLTVKRNFTKIQCIITPYEWNKNQ